MPNRTCSTEGCHSRIYKAGVCSVHFKRPLCERFWAKVDRWGECWMWTAGINHKGYGVIVADKKGLAAHRVSYELTYGPIPNDMQVDHVCHTPACVRPEHLRLATRKQQMENLAGAQANSRSGVRGVHWSRRQKRWKATVGHDGETIHVGYFKTIEEAETAVVNKRLRLYTHNEVDRRQAC